MTLSRARERRTSIICGLILIAMLVAALFGHCVRNEPGDRQELLFDSTIKFGRGTA